MNVSVISIFPEMFRALTDFGITKRAKDQGIWSLEAINPRDFTNDVYRRVDDRPYGGGPGMVMMPEPLEKAVCFARERYKNHGVTDVPVIYLSPQGQVFSDQLARYFATLPGLILIAGRYEGVDERFISRHVDQEISVGDFVVSGGELPAMMVLDAVIRWLPNVLNDQNSAVQDSFARGILDCPHYTRPEHYAGETVPPVLLSGNHAEIATWRLQQALGRTWERRPDLLKTISLSKQESRLLELYKQEQDFLKKGIKS